MSDSIGPHSISRVGDVLELRLTGPITLADVIELRERVRAVRREHGACFMLADAAGLTGITAEARQTMSQWSRSNPEDRVSGVAVFGVNFAMRTLITLTISAIRFLGRREVMLGFCPDEAASQAWIEGRRAALASGESTA